MPTHPSGGPQPGRPIGQTVPGVAVAQMAEGGNVAMTGPQRPGMNPVMGMPQQMHPHMMNPQFRPGGQMRVTAPGNAMHDRQFMASQSDTAMMKHRLNKIYMMNTDTGGGVPTMYAPNMGGSMMVPGGPQPRSPPPSGFQPQPRSPPPSGFPAAPSSAAAPAVLEADEGETNAAADAGPAVRASPGSLSAQSSTHVSHVSHDEP